MNSSIASCPRTSACATGWMIHVMRTPGHARRSAFATGSTWTASPSALSITIATERGGASDTKGLMERGQLCGADREARGSLELAPRTVEAPDHRIAVQLRPQCEAAAVESAQV